MFKRAYLSDTRFNSILTRYFLVCVSFIAICSFLLNAVYNSRLSSRVNGEICSINESSLTRSANLLENVLRSMGKLTFSLADQEGAVWLSVVGTLGAVKADEKHMQTVREAHQFSRKTYNYIDSIYTYLERSGTVIVTSNDVATEAIPLESLTDVGWLEQYEACKGKRTVTMYARMKREYWPYLITLMLPIRTSVGAVSGAVALNINVRRLGQYLGVGTYRRSDEAILLVYHREAERLIYADEYRLLSAQEPEMTELTEMLARGERESRVMELWGRSHVVSFGESADGDFAYCYFNTLASYEEYLQKDAAFRAAVFALTLILAVVVSILLAYWAYKPIRNLLALARQVPLGNAQSNQANEIESIKAYILATQGAYKKLCEQIDERTLSLHNAQINALQSQIDPHFLYNTMEVISEKMIMTLGRENECSDMLHILAKLLRLSLSTKAYLAPLREEIDHARLYMQIMTFRSGGQIQCDIDIPESLMDTQVVKLSLQPIIENALQHGLRPKRYRGRVALCASLEGEDFVIFVRDDGVGLSPEALRELNQKLRKADAQDYQHIGLLNVNQRIRLIFGESSGIRIAARPEGGVEVQLRYHGNFPPA